MPCYLSECKIAEKEQRFLESLISIDKDNKASLLSRLLALGTIIRKREKKKQQGEKT